MVDDFVDPVEGLVPANRVEPRPGPRGAHAPTHAGLSGHVIAVRRRSGHHEGEHVLDTSVGAEEYTEIVIRLDEGTPGDLVGKPVVVHLKP